MQSVPVPCRRSHCFRFLYNSRTTDKSSTVKVYDDDAFSAHLAILIVQMFERIKYQHYCLVPKPKKLLGMSVMVVRVRRMNLIQLQETIVIFESRITLL